jgi:hypothetical protein
MLRLRLLLCRHSDILARHVHTAPQAVSTLPRPKKASNALQTAAAVSTLPRSSKGWTDTKGVERRPSTRRLGMECVKRLGVQRNWSAALTLFRQLQQQSKQPATIFMYNVTLTALARSRRYQVKLGKRSQTVCKDIQQREDKGRDVASTKSPLIHSAHSFAYFRIVLLL